MCIQRVRNRQCSKLPAGDIEYPGYCSFHINRFRTGLDTPNPFEEVDNFINLQLAPFINGHVDIQLINFLDNRANIFFDRTRILENRRNLDEILLTQISRLIDINEQTFLILNYERLYTLAQQRLTELQHINEPIERPDDIRVGVEIINLVNQILQDNAPRRQANNLAGFINDRENIHTTELVNPVVEVSKKLINIGNNKPAMQDTFKEVIITCNLTDDARKQLCLMYYSKDSIYNLCSSTYQKVMDGLWFYSSKQPEEIRKEIYTRLSFELEDNVGSCPQGNLSRIVNTLTGFIEGLEPVIKESFQDRMSKVSQIPDKNLRLQEAKKAFIEYKIKPEEQRVWLEALEDI